jgi:hypothetical protein
VYAADTGQPVRRAIVMLLPAAEMPAVSVSPADRQRARESVRNEPRNAATDASGRFELTAIPAGSYRLVATPGSHNGQYLPAIFGSPNRIDHGRVIDLNDGQVFDADFPLLRGGAIAGRIVDEMGDPISRASVSVSRRVPGTSGFRRAGAGLSQSDDHGRYRVYGLDPGDYVVHADARTSAGPALEGVEPESFVTTYHPAAIQEDQAATVTLRPGSEVDGIDIQLIRTRTFRITGVVMDSQGRILMRPNAQLARFTADGSASTGLSVDASGRFTIDNLVPGDYTFVVRPAFSVESMPQRVGAATGPAPAQNGEYASVPLTVVSDIENLVVVTQPGATVKGRVVFIDNPGVDASALRVTTQPGARSMMSGPGPVAAVSADGEFTLADLTGSTLVRIAGLRADWALRAIMLGSDDITDRPVEFRKEHSGHLEVVVTTRAAAIEGTITDDEGKPVEQAAVLVFPDERDAWRAGSTRVKIAATQKGGRYAVQGLVGGRYYAVASRTRIIWPPDTPEEIFESLAREATRFVVAGDERRVVDLRVTSRPE